jgi:hypothetical protein
MPPDSPRAALHPANLRSAARRRAAADGAPDRVFDIDRDRSRGTVDWLAAVTIGERPGDTFRCSSAKGGVAAEKVARNPSGGKGADGALGLV